MSWFTYEECTMRMKFQVQVQVPYEICRCRFMHCPCRTRKSEWRFVLFTDVITTVHGRLPVHGRVYCPYTRRVYGPCTRPVHGLAHDPHGRWVSGESTSDRCRERRVRDRETGTRLSEKTGSWLPRKDEACRKDVEETEWQEMKSEWCQKAEEWWGYADSRFDEELCVWQKHVFDAFSYLEPMKRANDGSGMTGCHLFCTIIIVTDRSFRRASRCLWNQLSAESFFRIIPVYLLAVHLAPCTMSDHLLWPLYVIGGHYIFCPAISFYLLSSSIFLFFLA